MAEGGGMACDYCQVTSAYLVTREVPGSPFSRACKTHLAIAAEKVAERAQAGSVTVYVVALAVELGTGGNAVEQVFERVRRLGAYSAKHPQAAHTMEDELYRAVLGLIAQGAEGPAALAATALTSQNYHFGRGGS